MPTPAELREQANAKRDMAARARRWAREMTTDTDHDHLLTHAAELAAEAAELDRQAAAQITQAQPAGYSTSQPVQQAQQQQQREGPIGADGSDKRKE